MRKIREFDPVSDPKNYQLVKDSKLIKAGREDLQSVLTVVV